MRRKNIWIWLVIMWATLPMIRLVIGFPEHYYEIYFILYMTIGMFIVIPITFIFLKDNQSHAQENGGNGNEASQRDTPPPK